MNSKGSATQSFFLAIFIFGAALMGITGCLASADEPGIPQAAQDPLCTDVAFYDFHNSLLSVRDGVALAAQPNDQDALPFKNGVCELRDDPTSDKPDWHYELLGDFVMRPTNNAKVRVIRIFENHLSGSGSWDRLMAFMCRGGKLEKIWQKRFASGYLVKRVNEIQFKISKLGPKSKSTKNKKTDPDVGLYQWDNKHLTFFKR